MEVEDEDERERRIKMSIQKRSANRLAIHLPAIVLLAAFGCGGGEGAGAKPGGSGAKKPEAGKVVIQNIGSDTMLQIAGKWSAEYRKVEPSVSVEVTGGGSGVGIKNLREGLCAIANASRDMTAAEKAQTKQNTGKDPVEFIVGYDAIGIYVHKDNPIVEISAEDLAGIYGEAKAITKWSQLGVTVPGSDEIVVVSRQNSSGTYAFFREHILKNKDYRSGMPSMSGSKDVVDLVSKTPGAIGYSGMGYKTGAVKFVNVSAKKGDKAYPPAIETVRDKTYPLARSLNMYTLGQPEGAVRKYLDWILSADGQKIVKDEGYIPLETGK
jgi:phosphate transport system substrate-binding protein